MATTVPMLKHHVQMIKYKVAILRDLQVVLRFTGGMKYLSNGQFWKTVWNAHLSMFIFALSIPRRRIIPGAFPFNAIWRKYCGKSTLAFRCLVHFDKKNFTTLFSSSVRPNYISGDNWFDSSRGRFIWEIPPHELNKTSIRKSIIIENLPRTTDFNETLRRRNSQEKHYIGWVSAYRCQFVGQALRKVRVVRWSHE